MELELLPTNIEDAEVVDRANSIMEFITDKSLSPVKYFKYLIAERNIMENKYRTSKAKQLELTDKYCLLSDKYSDLVDKHIALKDKHDPI